MPADGLREALGPLPVQALRLPSDVIDGLRHVGFDRIGDLMAAPRAPLVKRFGAVIALRLAQALGEQFESIHPLLPPDVIERRLMFVEPLSTPEAFAAVLKKLMRFVCRRLERASLGARQLDLLFERVNNSVQTIRIGTAQPSRDSAHLARLLRERFEEVDPGEGVEAMRLVATTAEPLEFAQTEAMPRRETTNKRTLPRSWTAHQSLRCGSPLPHGTGGVRRAGTRGAACTGPGVAERQVLAGDGAAAGAASVAAAAGLGACTAAGSSAGRLHMA